MTNHPDLFAGVHWAEVQRLAEEMEIDLQRLHLIVCEPLAREDEGRSLWARMAFPDEGNASDADPLAPGADESAEPDELVSMLISEATAFVLRWTAPGLQKYLDLLARAFPSLAAVRGRAGDGPVQAAGQTGSSMTELLATWVPLLGAMTGLARELQAPLGRAAAILPDNIDLHAPPPPTPAGAIVVSGRPALGSGLVELLEADRGFREAAGRANGQALRAYLAHVLRDYDPDAVQAELRQEFAAASLLQRLIAGGAEVVGTAPPTPSENRRQEAGRNERRALQLLLEHPEWSVTRIAEEVGVSRRAVYNMPLFRAAWEARKAGRGEFPRGWYRDKDGAMEAYE